METHHMRLGACGRMQAVAPSEFTMLFLFPVGMVKFGDNCPTKTKYPCYITLYNDYQLPSCRSLLAYTNACVLAR